MKTTRTIKRAPAVFYETSVGNEPVWEWLRSGRLTKEDRKIIGTDIATAEYGWPIGMPTCRSITSRKGLWEIRSSITNGRIARVLFCVHDGKLVLLHGLVKKSQQTPDYDLDLAVKRQKQVEKQ